MAKGSIFDCDGLENSKKRTQVVYDEDIFAFGDATPIKNEFGTTTSNIKTENIQNGKPAEYKQSQRIGKRKIEYQTQSIPKVRKIADPRLCPRRDIGSMELLNPPTKYTLLKLMGKGTYGEVHQAQMNDTKKIIAVKRMIVQLNRQTTVRSIDFGFLHVYIVFVFVYRDLLYKPFNEKKNS